MLKILAGVFGIILFAVSALIVVLCVKLSPTLMARCVFWRDADVEDYLKFPLREIKNATPVFHFGKNLRDSLPSAFSDVLYKSGKQEQKIGDLDKFLKSTDTTSFIVIQDDVILYEQYFNGYERDSINTSFSVAKSFGSVLIGIAVDEGYIRSIDEPITNYIPELDGEGFDSITIKHLISMSAGLKYYENGLPWGDDAMTNYYPDLRKLALTVEIEEPPELHFHYNNYYPLLIGMILERAIGQSVGHYLQEKIWKPLGMEFPASWSLDSKKTKFEKMESGLNARSIDFAKFGRLFLNKGRWDGKQIISEKWVVESTSPMPVDDYNEYYIEACKKFNPKMGMFFESGMGFYKYFWWGYTRENDEYDFIAEGNKGQLVYVSPRKNAIIVRNGKSYGGIDNWPEIAFQMVERL
jgi:CubicO group peptidase (beta-lactamase class C family)